MNHVSLFKDPVVTCPYDRLHRIALSRIQSHIVKCEKNYPPGYKKTCPYNATHRLFDYELQDHLQVCPQKVLIEPESCQYVENHGSQMSDFIAQPIVGSTLDHGESWDEESQMDRLQLNDGSRRNSDIPLDSRESDELCMNLRRPRGYSEAMMIGEESDVAEISDIESVASVMGIGRGRITQNNIDLYRRLHFGRGRYLTKIE